jgi:hypothetical protein
METKDEYAQVTKQDRELGLVYPFCGELSDEKIALIYKILCNHLSNKKKSKQKKITKHTDKMIKFIKGRMSFEKLAVVMKKSTGEIYVNENKRMCLRNTFNKNIVSQLSDVLIDVIKSEASMQCIVPSDIRFEESHGDILYYKSGGFFGNHRDMVLECPFKDPSEWKMYTLIICLDSNLTETINEGATAIFLPSRHYAMNNNNHNYNSDKLMIEHIFNQTIVKKNFLIFPAEALHSSKMITKINGFKLVLKFDLWLKIPKLTPILKPYTEECKCSLCYYTYKINTYSDQLSLIPKFEIIPFDVICMISKYLISKPQRECICCKVEFDICRCTCSECSSQCPIYHDIDNVNNYNNSPSYSEDECNGYLD